MQSDRISSDDTRRQARTAAEILRRLNRQPGLILADEVGMGKTYVALAVAVSVVEATEGERPVVVMVPPSVGEKWPREWDVFRELCLKGGPTWIRAASNAIVRPAPFFKLLDDPARTRKHIIFLTHGALTNALVDPYTRLALIRRALKRKALSAQRRAFPRWADSVLATRFRDPKLIDSLLEQSPRNWRAVLKRARVMVDDDPVPDALLRVLPRIDIEPLIEALGGLPLRTGPHVERRLKDVRNAMRSAVQEVWSRCMREMAIELPLLVLDEAHHLKNRGTRFASLFASPEAKDDADVLQGPFAGVFDRMLFLTATPFQLGHHELVEVLRRFEAIRWGDGLERAAYVDQLDQLENALSAAQTAALRLDRAWGRLAPEDVGRFDGDHWWRDPENPELSDSARSAARRLAEVGDRMHDAEKLVRPWVIRHARPDREKRRDVRSGRAILGDEASGRGLEVEGSAVLPFLLAARVQAIVASDGHAGGARARAFFAEGLASSFEAYRDTRARQQLRESIDDVEPEESSELPPEAAWYLTHLDQALPEGGSVGRDHPKIAAIAKRVLELWRAGEKSVVFCFYVATGRALRAHISHAIEDDLLREAARQLRIDMSEKDRITSEVERLSLRFFDPDAPVVKAAAATVQDLFSSFDLADGDRQQAVDVVLRFLRTPSFLVRYTDLAETNRVKAFERALDKTDASGRSLRVQLEGFGQFLVDRIDEERAELLEALSAINTGAITTSAEDFLLPGEDVDRHEASLPNVRLANGGTSRKARRRLMLTFNTPFFPEVLISSAVMGEGVDLHHECRHAVHHDLDWNPSILEQRTGRLDRLGSKAEVTGLPIVVYEPFLEGTQDEKQFRVVKDRERWFNVVMGEKLELDERSTERIAERIPLPVEAAEEIALRLEIVRR